MKNFSFPPLRGSFIPSAVGALLLFSALAPPALAFTDVPTGSYYEDAAAALLSSGALDQATRLRPADLATRAELVQLLVKLEQTPLIHPTSPGFSDVPVTAWYSTYFETAARMNWVGGDDDCYGNYRPCTARPSSGVNRAEAATLLTRVFELQNLKIAPQFPDNRSWEWYYDNIQTAADHCILQGDDITGTVRPGSFMNRAEMVVMFHRASQNMRYGNDCGVLSSHISSVSVQSAVVVRVSFNTDLHASVAKVPSHYAVRRVSDRSIIGISSASLVNARTVELTLDSALAAETNYTVLVNDIVSTNGVTFSDAAQFASLQQAGSILRTTAPTARRVLVQFDTDLSPTRAELPSHYTVQRASGTAGITVTSATLTSPRTVELVLESNLSADTSYQVTADSLLTSESVIFSDSDTFMFQPSTGTLSDVSVSSSARITLGFNTTLDPVRAQSLAAFTVFDGNHNLLLSEVRRIGDSSVELTFAEVMSSQRSYTVNVQNMLTPQGTEFDATRSFLYNANGSLAFNTTLNGGQEVPSVSTSASGTGKFILTANGLQYDITVRNLTGSQITGAHFHSGRISETGPVLQEIIFSGLHATGTWNLSDADRNLLLDDKIYMNVHSVLYPNGEIRAQLQP